jgi:Family of unknown function (DUF6636)
MKRVLAAIGFVLLVGAVAATMGSAGVSKSARISAFKSPKRNIICVYLPAGGGQQAGVECGIKSGLKPPPPRRGPACKHLDYVHDRIDLLATGRAHPVACAGDAGAFAYAKQARVLKYGRTFHKGGIWCSSHPSGMTCTNKSAHGFFLSKPRYKKF